MTKDINRGTSLFTLMSNTVLFGVGAGLIGYCWLKFSIHSSTMVAVEDTWWTINERLMLSTIALLLAGFFHSIMILYPEFMKQDKKIIEEGKQREELQYQALYDSLTGIHNRRFFDASLEAYLKEFDAAGANLGLLLLDLDHFKNINDKFGHKVGDTVLQSIATILTDNSRKHDVVARVGGEEFAVITRCTDKQQLAKIANRYREAIGKSVIKHENALIRPTVSIGLASNEDSADPEVLYQIADMRLYQAKQKGRNQVAA